MKNTLFLKLITAFLGLTIIILVATLGLARWSFENGFLDYVNAIEHQRLDIISEKLATEYIAAEGDWSAMPPRYLHRLLSGRPPPGKHRPPPPNSKSQTDRPFHSSRPPRARKAPPTVLQDTDGKHIIGSLKINHTKPVIRIPVKVNNEIVAWLITQPRRHFDSPQETAFSSQQWQTSLLIAIAALTLALIISLLLAKRLLTPLQNMMQVIRRLSAGDYEQSLNHTSKDELGRLANDIDQLAATLKDNHASRRRWLADISHELRTPVTILTGELAALQDGIRPFNTQQLNSLVRETERLRHLIDDLYQLSLSELGGMHYEFNTINFSKYLQNFIKTTQQYVLDKELLLYPHIEPDIYIKADSRRIDQLLTNLFKNALDYTDTPGKIKLSLKHQNQRVILSIEDSPPGVTEQDCQQLFKPLYRHDESRSRHSAGAGLGLAICRNIVHAHRGEIIAKPSVLGGLLIEIQLPFYDEAIS